MSGIMSMVLGAKTAIAAAVDAYFNLVTLLLPGDGTNGAQNNTFLDSSTNNFTITRNGNATQGTFSPFSQTGWSNYFDGTGDYLSLTGGVTDNGTGDITFEFWSYYTGSYSAEAVAFDSRVSPFTNGFAITVAATSGYWTMNFASQDILTSTAAAKNAWQHVALTRSGNTFRLFVDGVLRGTLTSSNNLSNNTNKIGASYNNGSAWPGYISNLRAIKGSIPTAYQTSSTTLGTSVFTPPTAPLTAVSGTSLLTCQANRFLDASTNAFTITPTGDTSVQAFSPFAPTAAYSTTDVGGSGYFDGSGDYLTAVSSSTTIGTQAFTVEFWVYITGNGGDYVIQNGSGGLQIWSGIGGGGAIAIGYANVSNLFTANTAPPKNQWVHIAVSKDATLARVYLNGVLDGSTTPTGWNFSGSGDFQFCVGNTTPTAYISGMRITIGAALYTANFTPPTSPPTASVSSGTVRVLLNFTNAGITDATAKNDLETVGNAQISTTQSKFGGSSMYFDGTGDYLLFPSSENFQFGTGDFTIEFWYYTSTTSGWRGLVTTSTSDEAGTFRILLVTGNTGIRVHTGASTDYDFTVTLVANAWNHVALVRNGGVYSLYYNGTKNGTTHSDSTNLVKRPLAVGANFTNGNEAFNGYIDDLRITKGYARYTANFSAPSAAFPLQ